MIVKHHVLRWRMVIGVLLLIVIVNSINEWMINWYKKCFKSQIGYHLNQEDKFIISLNEIIDIFCKTFFDFAWVLTSNIQYRWHKKVKIAMHYKINKKNFVSRQTCELLLCSFDKTKIQCFLFFSEKKKNISF